MNEAGHPAAAGRTRRQPVRARLLGRQRRQHQREIAKGIGDGYLITPTNSSLGRLDAARLSRLDAEFRHVGGDKPSKEVFMHRAFYRASAEAGAVVHLHSTQATAVACLPDVDRDNPIPPLTPYFVMRVGRRMPIVEYYRPGDPAMEPAIHRRGAAMHARCCWQITGRWYPARR